MAGFGTVADSQGLFLADINGDGFDDLLVSHDPSRNDGHVNAVKLYFGGERIDNRPDITSLDFTKNKTPMKEINRSLKTCTALN